MNFIILNGGSTCYIGLQLNIKEILHFIKMRTPIEFLEFVKLANSDFDFLSFESLVLALICNMFVS